MARTHRKSLPPLKDTLFEEPYSFEFHQAVKILEMLSPDAEPFGEGVDPSKEPVSIKGRVFFESLASDIYSLDTTGKSAYRHNPHYVQWDGEPPQMQVNFMGLAGLPGPLPYAYAEMIIQRERSGDTSLRDFLDIFNHRLISILHRLRKQYIVGLSTVKPDKSPHAMALRSLLGILQKNTQNRMHTPDRGFLEFAGLFWSRPHSAQALNQILSSYFDFPIKVEQCVGKWRKVDNRDVTHIGSQAAQWNTLGDGAMLGTKVWDQQGKIRLHIGPLNTDQFDNLLPGESGYKSLLDIVELFIGPEVDFDMNLMIEEDEIEASKLSTGSGLGWNTWLSYIPLGKFEKPVAGKRIKLVDKQVIIDPKDVAKLRKSAVQYEESLLREAKKK
jgi:type VI secretion system protein ImpH